MKKILPLMFIAPIAMTSCTKQSQGADDLIQQNKAVEDSQRWWWKQCNVSSINGTKCI
ncbi:MAG TPA: hypothetical protein VNT20_16505 [Flavisolibacter sp.]|nr:hypothetical protein [Flavisolibacter sp.]